MQRVYDLGIGLEVNCRSIGVEVSGLNIEDVDEDTNIAENLAFLAGEVVLGESILAVEADCQQT